MLNVPTSKHTFLCKILSIHIHIPAFCGLENIPKREYLNISIDIGLNDKII